MSKLCRSEDDSIFYMHDSRTFCDVSTRGYMRLKMNNGSVKFTYVGDGIDNPSHYWNVEQKDKQKSVLMTIQEQKHETMKIVVKDKVVDEYPITLLHKPAVYKELSVEEMKVMVQGLQHMIDLIEGNDPLSHKHDYSQPDMD